MEAELEQRRELEEEAAEGGGEFDLQRRQPRQHNNGFTTAVTINGMSTTASLSSSSSSEYSLGADLISQLVEEGEFSYESFALTSGEVNFNDSNNKSTTPGTVMVDIATESFGIETIDELSKSTDPPPSSKNSSIQEQIAAETSIDIGAIEQEGRVSIDIREEIEEQKETTDLYLETVYKKPATSDFYCPNCQACIDKVLIRSRLEEEELRCPSCFAFLKPLAESWLPKWRGTQPKEQTPHPQKSHVPINTIIQGNKEPSYQSKPGDTFHPTPSSTLEARTPTAVTGEILEGNKEPTYQLKPGDTLRPPLPLTAQSTPEQDGTIKLEIVKSLVYGGLTESIASLSVVTSAASAAASTLSILVLALANLIGGLFIIGHNLRDLKNEQSRVNLNEAEEQVDRYLQVLGQKKNFMIHASVAVLSFLVFGLVPPVVYGFSFYKSDNSYLKLAVVAAASLISITILAIAKAYIKKPTRWYMYLRTVTYYVSLGVGASGISYLAGYLFKLLIDKLGWFESSAAVTLSLPGMSSVPSAQVSSY
ncbi:membrane protein of ER body-like protein isoform X3 [Juglans microcarpa x Juglans regia]|uniref:membrane protein of ER body-like protein isoform X3 n=1 Tax=Juglans microcarpa x Juglans regia TaxID=2249226 RepID=UPI001B7DC77E|nr:membrane protein of ER body-like protein isoform X3 [Juglans microcarpa x Juglans regia]